MLLLLCRKIHHLFIYMFSRELFHLKISLPPNNKYFVKCLFKMQAVSFFLFKICGYCFWRRQGEGNVSCLWRLILTLCAGRVVSKHPRTSALVPFWFLSTFFFLNHYRSRGIGVWFWFVCSFPLTALEEMQYSGCGIKLGTRPTSLINSLEHFLDCTPICASRVTTPKSPNKVFCSPHIRNSVTGMSILKKFLIRGFLYQLLDCGQPSSVAIVQGRQIDQRKRRI